MNMKLSDIIPTIIGVSTLVFYIISDNFITHTSVEDSNGLIMAMVAYGCTALLIAGVGAMARLVLSFFAWCSCSRSHSGV